MEKMEIDNLIFWKDKKVLITGHNGFKGSWLTTWLLSLGANIFGYSLDIEENSLYENLNFEIQNEKNFGSVFNKEGNINEFQNICSFVNEIEPDIVFHLAAQPLVSESYKDPLRTWNTNVIGTLNLLESLKQLSKKCAVVLITTDKVYKNKEWIYGYREIDELGGKDPYSASKAAMELAINSWISSFCGDKNYQTNKLEIASARSGNVIGGGDFSKDRIVPDLVKSIFNKDSLLIRNPNARRPWLHVLEPLSGYLLLAESLYKKQLKTKKSSFANSAYNFGPNYDSNKKVIELVEEFQQHFEQKFNVIYQESEFFESNLLHLVSEKSKDQLNWRPKWDFAKNIKKTAFWYKKFNKGVPALTCCMHDILEFTKNV